MNKALLYIILFLLCLNIKAQQLTGLHLNDPCAKSIEHIEPDTIFFDYTDNEPEPSPISILPKYREIIKPVNLKPNFLTPSFNNDSLYRVYNKDRDPNSNAHMSGIGKNFEEMWFKQQAYKFELDTGTIWLYKASTITGKGVSIGFKEINIPEGAQLSFYFYYSDRDEFDYEIHGVDDQNFNNRSALSIIGTDVYIEYFEPKNFKQTYDFQLSGWTYSFAHVVKTIGEVNLKAGTHGTSIDNANCNNDINCPDAAFNHWRDLNKRVCYIKQIYRYMVGAANYEATIHGSGVFINKSGNGYTQNDKPYILTCKHIFSYDVNGQMVDLNNPSLGTVTRLLYHNYKNDVCNSSKRFKGSYIGDFSHVKSGSSYKPNDPNYKHSEDYGLLQSSHKMKKFAKYGVTFSSWRQYIQLNSPYGVASFGHPKGDVMKICIDNDHVYKGTNIGDERLRFYYDVGTGEEGMSGGPAFNYHKDLVGIVVTKSGTPICKENQEQCSSQAGNFQDIYPKIKQYIDPTNKTYSADKIYASLTPGECRNCQQDFVLGETGMDCGGDCMPCYVPTNSYMNNKQEFIQSDKVSAKYNINVSLNEEVKAQKRNMVYRAGDEITIRKNVIIDKGSTLLAELEPQLSVNDIQREATISCVHVTNAITPNGDGKNDFIYMNQKGVFNYRIIVNDRYGRRKYDSGQQSVLTDGWIAIYDGKGTSRGNVYPSIVEYWDSNNKKRTTSVMIHSL